jgi:hypothetical protein
VEDGLNEYEFPESIGEDQEIEGFFTLKNSFESELKFVRESSELIEL